jgi:uncharacterized cupin superfamily protein
MSKVIIEKVSPQQIRRFGIDSWPIWTKEISRFDWHYASQEQCYFIEGEAEIETEEGNYTVRKGDFVTFQQGLKCTWNVIKPVQKHYNFE